MALKINNRSRYRTDDLRAFFRAGLLALGADLDKKITVINARGLGAGLARTPRPGQREANWIRISLPSIDKLDTRYIAQIFEHEVGHNLGLEHGEMIKWWTLEPTWHEGMPLRLKAVAEKPASSIHREANVRAKVAEYQQKLDDLERTKVRYQKILRKWRARARYYDRKAASTPQGAF